MIKNKLEKFGGGKNSLTTAVLIPLSFSCGGGIHD